MSNPFFLTVLYKEPGENPVKKDISNRVEDMNELVHGQIDSIGVDDGICVIFNALAEALKMDECCTIYGKTFYGPVLIIEFNENGQLCSLAKNNMQYYMNLCAE